MSVEPVANLLMTQCDIHASEKQTSLPLIVLPTTKQVYLCKTKTPH